MNIVHVIDALALGGAERMLVEIANRAAADGHTVAVCATRAGGVMAERLDPRIEVRVLGRQGRFDVRPLGAFVAWVRERRFDVAHCHGRSSFSLLASLAAARLLRTPIVLHDHLGVDIHPEVPAWFRVARRLLAAYVGVYPQHRDWAALAGIPSERAHVIGNAIDPAMLSTTVTTPLPDARPRLVCIGGLRREKAIDVLLDAMGSVPATLFVIGGDADPGYARSCRDHAVRAGLAERVVFVGQREDALALATTADLAVHASRSESGPLVLAEYAVLGVPFVTTRVGGIAHALEDAHIGAFVPPEDPVALAGAIRAALASPPETSPQRARALFDIANVMPRWYEVYERAAS